MGTEPSSSPTAAELFRKEDHSTLYSNLETFGWSPVLVDAKLLAMDLNNHQTAQHLLRDDVVANWETLHENMFDNVKSSSVTYREAESGAPGNTIEPKQSLELVRNSNQTTTPEDCITKDDSVFMLMNAWISIFHSVAQKVASILEWPEGTLIDASNDEQGDHPTMDLLRAFLYEAVPDAMGSSPHTDWGSLTIVWQDRVGGLETFCRSDNQWLPVPPLPTKESIFPLIVHIGDTTSLAMGKSPLWPSPLHRVRCSGTRRRSSLVYFCYPPKGSLRDLQKRLKTTSDALIDESCSLLQDQSLQETARGASPWEVYERIVHQPLHDVFREKWAQVQR